MYVEIASKKIEFSKHFGPEFGEKTVQMDISEGVTGIYVKSITFYAQVKQFHKRDSELFDRCVEWRREKYKMQQERNQIQSLARQADNMEIKKERVYELKKRNTAPDISLLFDQLQNRANETEPNQGSKYSAFGIGDTRAENMLKS